ncbi:unnamed protein product [Brassica rapa subsp. narinosa]
MEQGAICRRLLHLVDLVVTLRSWSRTEILGVLDATLSGLDPLSPLPWTVAEEIES